MSHVADGELHAYLDGALDLLPDGEGRRIRTHLEGCEACRRRLREEERVREAAGGVLARTGPAAVEPPPFESLRRRAGVATGDDRTRARLRLVTRLGWAASVMVALGVGWGVGRVGGAGPDGPARTELSSSANEAGSQEPAFRASADEAGVELAERFADAAPIGGEGGGTVLELEAPAAPADSMAAPGTVVGRAVLRGTETPLENAQVSVAGTPIGALTDDEGRFALAGVPPGSRTVRLQLIGYGPLSQTLSMEPGDTAFVEFAPMPSAVALEALSVTGSTPSPQVDSLAAARGGVEQARRLLRDTAQATGGEAPGDARADVVEARERGTPAEPSAAGRGLALPGLEVLQVEWTEVAPGVDGLKVVQRMAGDTTRLELRFGGMGAGDDAAVPPSPAEEDLADGVNQVSRSLVGDGGWVVLRARLPVERLERLLDLLR